MRKKIETLFLRLQAAIRHNPVEVLLAVLFCVIGCISYESRDNRLDTVLAYSPVLFLATYILNALMGKGRWRFVYYLSVIFFIPFLWKKEDVGSAFWLVSLCVIQLFYLIAAWQKDNRAFFQRGLAYLRALLSAGLLSGIAWLLSMSIYFSIRYIFEIWQSGEGRFTAYSLSIAFAGIMPLLFLMFNYKDEDEDEQVQNRLFDVLLNYVLTPALLIYAVILYLYFIKIAVLWSLPKGAVAYIVVSFVSALFVLKGCQPFLTRRYFDWFYRFASLIALPALVMYWVGACYRINQYGFTQDRVYLVVVGAILSGVAGLFLMRRTGYYLYAALLAVLLLSAVTYIPGTTAKDIERISQSKRGNYPIRPEQYADYSYLTLTNNHPLDISGYDTMRIVKNYNTEGGMFVSLDMDTLRLFDESDNILYQEDLASLLQKQLKKVGLTPADSVPEVIAPGFFCIEMDSALLVIEEVNMNRMYKDSAYTITYLLPGVYLNRKE